MSISYPVPENSRWAVYDTQSQQIVRQGIAWPRADRQAIVNAPAHLVPLQIVEGTKPSFDPNTQRLEPADPIVDVSNNTLTTQWSVVALSQEQQDKITERNQIKAVYQDLKQGNGTDLQRLVRVERVAAHLLKQFYGDV